MKLGSTIRSILTVVPKTTKGYQARNCLYVDNTPIVRRSRAEESPNRQDHSVKLRPKKAGPFKAIRATVHTVTVDVDGLHHVVSIDRVSMARRFEEVELPEAPIDGNA